MDVGTLFCLGVLAVLIIGLIALLVTFVCMYIKEQRYIREQYRKNQEDIDQLIGFKSYEK